MSYPFQTSRDVRENPAEILREIAEGMVDGKTVLGVDHESFDRARDFMGSHITCDLGVGCNESGVCYAMAHGQPDQCGVTVMDGIDLSQIAPLTEAEAEAYFNAPTPKEKYDEAIKFLEQTYEYHAADIKRYVAYLKMRIRTAEDSQHAAEQSCLRHHQMGQ